jgi:cytidylate kinase
MIADLETRAKRRLLDMDATVSLKEVMDNIASRDATDSNRKADPLKKADDAIEINTGKFTFQEQVDYISEIIEPLLQSTHKQ